MQAEKKKTIIVAALASVMVAVGAFQFLGGHKSAPPAPAKKTDAPVADKSQAAPTVKNPEFAAALPVRDPFAQTAVATAEAKTPSEKIPTPPPIGGNIPKGVPSLPAASGPIGIQPMAAPAPTFGYTVAGIIRGDHPAAIFTDSTGAQRLISIGGSLDGDSKLVAVQDGDAIVSFRGKKLRLTVGGNPE